VKLEKAIEILRYIDEAETIMWQPDHYDALKLGIEALKQLKANREYGPMAGTGLLPGETTEEET